MIKKKRKPGMNEILLDDEKRCMDPPGLLGTLAKLFRIMLRDMNVGPQTWGTLMCDFMLDVRNCVPQEGKKRTSTKGNLMKEFARERMSWRTWCKALRFLQFWKIEFSVTAYRRGNPRPFYFTTLVNLGEEYRTSTLLTEEDLSVSEFGHEDDDVIVGDFEELEEATRTVGAMLAEEQSRGYSNSWKPTTISYFKKLDVTTTAPN